MKKLLAIILTLVMIFSALPFSAFAQEEAPQNTTQNFDLSSTDVALMGETSVGTMLANELETLTEQTDGTGNVIYEVEVELNSAYVELSTAVSATLFVGIYTEDCATLITSGYVEVTPQDEYTFVTLEENAPEYFYVKAYLVDTEDFSPVSSVYNNPMYTQEMQEFLSKTTDDFEEEKVVNFDDDKTNNFAIFSDEVLILEEQTETNKITFADAVSQIYILENIDETVFSLNVGDTFSGNYNGELFIITVGEISIDGTTATILGAEAELEEVFDYVKMDGSTGLTEDSVDENSCGEGITFEGYEQPTTYGLRGFDFEDSIGLDAKFKINLWKKGTDNANVSVTGNFNIKFVFSPKVYISTNYKYLELKFDYNLSGGISITGAFEHETPIAFLTFGLPGIRAEITPKFVFSASGSIGITGTLLKGTLGYGWYSDVGGVNLCSTPKIEAEIKAEITIFLGLRVDPKVKVLEGVIAEAGLEANLGVEAKAALKGNTSGMISTSKKHDCAVCVEGEIYGKFDLSIKGKLLKNKKWSLDWNITEIKIKIVDFYWSMTHGEFRFTTCPHISYKLDVVVSDNTGKALKNATVLINGDSYTTTDNGKISTYLPNGKYTITVSKTDFPTIEKSVTIKDDSKTVNISLSDSNQGSDDDELNSASNFKPISLGDSHSAAITENGDLYMWGRNYYGQLGDGTIKDSLTPKYIMSNVVSVSLGIYHSAAITKNGDLYLWGDNYDGQLGDGTTKDSLTPKYIMSNVASVSLGYQHSAAITKNGDLYLWGYNYYGQLGDGTTTNRYTPKYIMSNVASVSLGSYHSAAITKNGDLYLWGYNGYGQLGDGTITKSLTPKYIMSNVASVSLDLYHSAAITKNGDLYLWGSNTHGRLGDGTYTTRKTPKYIMSNVESVSLGGYHSAAITENGDLYLWGRNSYGQLGDGTTKDSLTPKYIMSNVASVSLGSSHSAAITKNGDLYLWGRNRYGQLGDGTTTDRYTPQQITLSSEISVVNMANMLLNATTTKTNDGLTTSCFENLAPNTIYNFYIMKNRSSEEALNGENLLYVNQAVTDENGVVYFEYANGTDFDTAEKFVVKFKNALPDNTISDIVVTANAQTLFVNVATENLLNGNYKNITAKLTVNGETHEITNYNTRENILVFTCDVSNEIEENSIVSVQLFADYKNATYECKENHLAIMDSRNDVNADGSVNSIDLILLKKGLFKETFSNNETFDPNADGEINIVDLIRLQKHLLNN